MAQSAVSSGGPFEALLGVHDDDFTTTAVSDMNLEANYGSKTLFLQRLDDAIRDEADLSTEDEDEYAEYVARFGKMEEYLRDSDCNYTRKYRAYEENVRRIEELNANANHQGEHYGINKFTDWDLEQRKELLQPLEDVHGRRRMGWADVPDCITLSNDHFDDLAIDNATRSGNVTMALTACGDVKDQGGLGTCWAFASTGQLQCNYNDHMNDSKVFSDKYATDCSNDTIGGINGGWMHKLTEWYDDKGACYDYHKEYNGSDETDYNDDCGCESPKQYGQCYAIYPDYDADVISKAAQHYAWDFPVALCNNFFDLSTDSPFWYGCGEDEELIGGHAMTLVWANSNFSLIRNSWGTDWGYEGLAVFHKDVWSSDAGSWYDAVPFTMTSFSDLDTTTDSSYHLVKESACFSATEFMSGYTFNAPYSGTLASVELQHVSGNVTCAGGRGMSYFGCTSTSGVHSLRVQMLRHNDGGSEELVFPTADDDDITSIEYDSSCMSGHECTVERYYHEDSDDLSDVLTWNSAAGVAVSEGDEFSLQYHEGCCGESTSDNSGESCVDVYFQYETIVFVGDAPMEWSEASDYCEGIGGQLLSIDSAETQRIAENLCEAVDHTSPFSWGCWTGLHRDGDGTGEWQWSDGQSTEFGFNATGPTTGVYPWAGAEPNNAGNGEDCIQLTKYHNFTWNDGNCESPCFPICKGSTVPPTVSPTTAAPTFDPTNYPTTDPTAPPTTAPTGSPSLAPTIAPSASPTPAPTDSDGHYVAHGRTSWEGWGDAADYYCQSNDDSQASYHSTKLDFDYDIGVGCCSMDGSTGYRPDCDAHPATYAEADALCTANGYRLCTLNEMMAGITEGTGCQYDAIYQWVADSCVCYTATTTGFTSDYYNGEWVEYGTCNGKVSYKNIDSDLYLFRNQWNSATWISSSYCGSSVVYWYLWAGVSTWYSHSGSVNGSLEYQSFCDGDSAAVQPVVGHGAWRGPNMHPNDDYIIVITAPSYWMMALIALCIVLSAVMTGILCRYLCRCNKYTAYKKVVMYSDAEVEAESLNADSV